MLIISIKKKIYFTRNNFKLNSKRTEILYYSKIHLLLQFYGFTLSVAQRLINLNAQEFFPIQNSSIVMALRFYVECCTAFKKLQ